MGAWGKDQKVGDKVLMLADGNAELTKKLGLELDGSGFGMGLRAKRFSMYLVVDGVVRSAQYRNGPGRSRRSGAETMLTQV